MIDALSYEFMQNALAAGLLASLTCGIIGSLVVVNRIVFISGGIAHAAYGGIGLAIYLGLPFMVGTLGFSLTVAMIMAAVTLKARHRSDTIIGVLWAVGMAAGVIFTDMTPGYNVDLMSYLFGSILAVPRSDLWIMAAMSGIILILTALFYHDFLAMSFDEDFARLRGVPVAFFHFLLLGMIALSVVMIIRVVGLVLVIALLTIPPYISEKYVPSLYKMMILSTLLSAVFTVCGLWLSYVFNLSSGAMIILTGGAAFFLSLLIDYVRFLIRSRKQRG